MNESTIDGYCYADACCGHMHQLLVPALLKELQKIQNDSPQKLSLFDLGCGNGSVANAIVRAGYEVTGCDPSPSGISEALTTFPSLKLSVGSGYDDLAAKHGHFPVVYALEVIEHVYDPRTLVRRVNDLLEPGGHLILSTPYHGYLKNLMLALTGKMDSHFTALWDHGHIKFWSQKTLSALLNETGFEVIRFSRLGRLPPIAMTMMMVARKIQTT